MEGLLPKVRVQKQSNDAIYRIKIEEKTSTRYCMSGFILTDRREHVFGLHDNREGEWFSHFYYILNTTDNTDAYIEF